jgi:hypothetical protein
MRRPLFHEAVVMDTWFGSRVAGETWLTRNLGLSLGVIGCFFFVMIEKAVGMLGKPVHPV